MNKYKVHYRVNGKDKYKTTFANTPHDARQQVRSKMKTQRGVTIVGVMVKQQKFIPEIKCQFDMGPTKKSWLRWLINMLLFWRKK